MERTGKFVHRTVFSDSTKIANGLAFIREVQRRSEDPFSGFLQGIDKMMNNMHMRVSDVQVNIIRSLFTAVVISRVSLCI